MVKKTRGRQKIPMRKIEKESNLQVTYSKRRFGLFKKASELATLCGAHILMFVSSPSGKIYSFGSSNVYDLIDRFIYRNYNSFFYPQPSNNMQLIPVGLDPNIISLNTQVTEERTKQDELVKDKKSLVIIRDKRYEKGNWWEKKPKEMNLNEVNGVTPHLHNLMISLAKQMQHQHQNYVEGHMLNNNVGPNMIGASNQGDMMMPMQNSHDHNPNMMMSMQNSHDHNPNMMMIPMQNPHDHNPNMMMPMQNPHDHNPNMMMTMQNPHDHNPNMMNPYDNNPNMMMSMQNPHDHNQNMMMSMQNPHDHNPNMMMPMHNPYNHNPNMMMYGPNNAYDQNGMMYVPNAYDNNQTMMMGMQNGNDNNQNMMMPNYDHGTSYSYGNNNNGNNNIYEGLGSGVNLDYQPNYNNFNQN